MHSSSSRICIIGAGISGIATAKFLKEKGLRYDCFEASSVLGGNWVFKNPNRMSSAYRSLHIDTSKKKLEFPDFPMPETYPTFCHHTHIRQYFEDLVDHFDLRESIRFGTPVRRAELTDDGDWRITLDEEIRRYDHLIVATGHHWDPKWPDFAGHFEGPIIHSHDYIDPFEPLDLKGKRVLVVGIGNSAVDIACELSNRGLAERLILSTRRGAHVVPKYLLGKPIDQIVETNPHIPLKLQRKAAALLVRLLVGRVESFGMPTPDHELLTAHPTVSSDLLQRVGNGDITVKPNVARLRGDRVEFVDQSVEPIDAIIYATGYKITFPFFDEDFLSAPDNVLPLFKRVFVPGIDNLMFVGFAQAIPSIIGFVQDQARWIVSYLTGEYALPSQSEMEDAIRRDEARHASHYVASSRHTMQVDHVLYARDLAKEWKRGRKRARTRERGIRDRVP
ncbi:MAG: NAD(P)-binding domain-containing protein [Myxococcales bacterium]|jgi:cation diffusion facilitator CzcD-associated flavoprotein CzcO